MNSTKDNSNSGAHSESEQTSGLYLTSGIAGMMINGDNQERPRTQVRRSLYGMMRDMYDGMVTLNDAPNARNKRSNF